MTRRRWPLALLLLALLLPALAGWPGARPAGAAPDGPLTIEAPASAPAGDTVAIGVRGSLPDGAAVTLVAIGTWGPRTYRAAASGGGARFALDPAQARKSGLVTLVATAGAARGEARLTILPGPAAEPVVPLIGPRSIVADGREWTMIAIVPQDAFGNPLAEGTAVRLNARHPEGADEQRDLAIRHLLTWARVESRTRAGHGTIAATIGDIPGPEATYQEVPGWPVALDLRADPPTLPADGRQFVTLRTGILRDRFDNVVADGTLVTFIVASPEGEHRTIAANTIGGVAEAQLRAPTVAITLAIRATVPGLESAPLALAFTAGPAAGEIAVTARSDRARGVLAIEAGPLRTAFGGYAPEGTAVTVRLIDGRGQVTTLDTTAQGGRATLEVRLASLAPGTYRIEISAGSGRGAGEVTVP